MKTPLNRREFLSEVGQGMLVASVGYGLAQGLGLSTAMAEEAPAALNFGSLEPMVCLMQETRATDLLPKLVQKMQGGTTLRDMVSAAALANARTFGGEDYIGFHTMMALAPCWQMSQELAGAAQALPIFKVLYRNTNRIQDQGGRSHEILHPVSSIPLPKDQPGGEALRDAVRQRDVNLAEQLFATLAVGSPGDAFNSLLCAVHDHTEVHRVVMPYRAWELTGLIGKEQAHTLLRQSVRYCVAQEGVNRGGSYDEPRHLLPEVLEEHKLMDYAAGNKVAEDSWVDALCRTIFESTPEQAAHAVAAALAEGFAPADIGEAITLAANQLILRDMGRTAQMEFAGKPLGSVHGDSIGVHACDSANAWRNMARVANPRNCFASLILGAHQVAKDRIERGGDFLHWQPMPLESHVKAVQAREAAALLHEAEEAIRENLQAHAAAIIQVYGAQGHDPRGAFDLMLKYAISEDGALHAEKFYRTVSDEFSSTRKAFRWRHLVALARVTASEYGRPAAGMAEARELLKV